MSNSFNHVVIYNGYPISIVVAIVFHSLLLAALLYLQNGNRTEVLDLIQPTVIKALLIDENPQVRNEEALERQRLERVEDQRQRREEEQRQEQQQLAEAEEQRQEAEAERERAALRERQELDRLQAEQLRQAQEEEKTRQEAETQRERELAAEQQRQREAAERDRQRQQEIAEAASAEAARTEFELVQSATGLIQQVVQENWSRPPSARNGMRVLIQIRMLPTGEVIDVNITQSSGDAAFDRAAETAVFRAEPFTELNVLPIKIFNENFRSLTLIFQPEDLLN
jgi:colicin import membrane protein